MDKTESGRVKNHFEKDCRRGSIGIVLDICYQSCSQAFWQLVSAVGSVSPYTLLRLLPFDLAPLAAGENIIGGWRGASKYYLGGLAPNPPSCKAVGACWCCVRPWRSGTGHYGTVALWCCCCHQLP